MREYVAVSYIPRPSPSVFDKLEKWRVIDDRQVYRGNGRLYTWDEFHGEVEVFTKRGRHLGCMDAVTEQWIEGKPARKDRRLRID